MPIFLLLVITYNPKCVVDGANDNLSGCYIGMAILHEMERRGITLEHTELGMILTGSEEAGLRGAKAWAKAHKGDYQDVPTYIISYQKRKSIFYVPHRHKGLSHESEVAPN